MPVVAGTNSLDFLKGTLPRLRVAPYVAAGVLQTTNYADFGYLRGVAPDWSRDVKIFSADNVTWDLDAYLTGSHISIKGELLESNLKRFAQVFGNLDTDVHVGTTPFTADFPIDEPATFPHYWQVSLIISGQSFKPAFNLGASPYDTRTVVLWRCMFEGKIAQTWKKDAEVMVPFVIHAFVDTSVTATDVKGRLGLIADTVGPYTEA